MTALSGVIPSGDNIFGALWILVGVVCVACGVTASATGGLQTVLQPLAPAFLATGINPGVLHRVTTMTTGIFDSLPHSSAIINGFQVFGVDHKLCYKYVFIETVVVPLFMTALGVILFTLGMQF
jgi:H+/gluconate symporter-like permease